VEKLCGPNHTLSYVIIDLPFPHVAKRAWEPWRKDFGERNLGILLNWVGFELLIDLGTTEERRNESSVLSRFRPREKGIPKCQVWQRRSLC